MKREGATKKIVAGHACLSRSTMGRSFLIYYTRRRKKGAHTIWVVVTPSFCSWRKLKLSREGATQPRISLYLPLMPHLRYVDKGRSNLGRT
jgi:hypothetical protein